MMEHANAMVYMVSAVSFVPASLGFLPGFIEHYVLACWVYIAGAVGCLWVGCYELVTASQTWADVLDDEGGKMNRFVTCSCVIFGSALYVVGTVLFLPDVMVSTYEQRCGAYMFIAGSILFTLAPFKNLTDVTRSAKHFEDVDAFVMMEALNFGGGILFTVGSIFCLPWQHHEHFIPAVAWTFFFGSLLFAGGSVLNFKNACRRCSTNLPKRGSRFY
jgi:hypothetical protein